MSRGLEGCVLGWDSACLGVVAFRFAGSWRVDIIYGFGGFCGV